MPTKSCFTCGWRNFNPQQCPLIGYAYAANRNVYCPYWVEDVLICDNCGKTDLKMLITETAPNTYKYLCHHCASLSGTCGSCTCGDTCDFETNPSPLPKAVQKQIRQGNQIAVVTIKNSERIDITCRKNCKCFDAENDVCNKENTCCSNYIDKEMPNVTDKQGNEETFPEDGKTAESREKS